MSLGSDEEDESASDDTEGEEEGNARGKQVGEKWAFPADSRGQLEKGALLAKAVSSHSFLSTAHGGGGARQQPPGK